MPKTLQIFIVSELPARTNKFKQERSSYVADLYLYNPTAYFSEDLKFHLSYDQNSYEALVDVCSQSPDSGQ